MGRRRQESREQRTENREQRSEIRDQDGKFQREPPRRLVLIRRDAAENGIVQTVHCMHLPWLVLELSEEM